MPPWMGRLVRDIVLLIVLGYIGNCHKRFGDFDRALELLLRALVMKKEMGDRLEEGKEVTVGIRPHDIAPVTEGHGAEGVGTLPFHVNLTEALGGETYAYGEVCGHDVVVRLDPSCAPAAGERLDVAPTAVQLFDVEDGRTLRS